MTATVPGRGRRRWRFIALAVLLAGAGLIAGLPWMLEIPAIQRRLAAEGSKVLAPSSVDFGAIHFSWFRPTQVSGLVLRDAQGDQVITAHQAVFQWNLREILFNRPNYATLALHRSSLDIERRPDGTIDLYEALRPVISDHPEVRLVIQIDNSRLRFRDPSLPEPVIADQADLDIDLGRDSQPIAWNIRLAQSQTGPENPRLNIEGNFSRVDIDSTENHDVKLGLTGTRWPWTLTSAGVQSRGDFTGTIDAHRRSGRLNLAGDVIIGDFVAFGGPLSTDKIVLDKIHAAWKAGGGNGAWTIERLELTTPLGSLKAEGSLPTQPDDAAWLEGTVDLAALARQLPATLHLRDGLRVEHGTARLNADLLSDPDGKTQIGNVTAKVADLVAQHGSKRLTLRDPATVIAKIRLRENLLQLQRLDVQTPYLSVSGQGDLDRGITVSAAVDLAAFRERFQDWIDLGTVELAGAGKIDGRYRREAGSYHASANASFRDLRVGGLPMGETLKCQEASLNADASGSAATAGWPVDWRVLTVQGRSGPAEFKIHALADASRGPVVVDGHVQTQLELSGRRRQIEGDLKASWDERDWIAERISLSLAPVTKPETRAFDEAIRWSGRGRYDVHTDELVIESTPGPPSTITGRQTAHVKGLKDLGATQIEVAATTDIAPIHHWLRPDERTWTGQLDTLMRARREKDLWNLGLRVELRDLAHWSTDDSPVALGGNVVAALTAAYAPSSDRLDLTEMGVRAPYVQIDGSGAVGDLTSKPRVDLKGSINPDWAKLNDFLARKIEPNAKISGGPRGWRVAGAIPSLTTAASWPGSLEGDFGISVDSLDVFGMRLAETALVVRAKDGQLRIDPIDTTLNDGALHVEPELIVDKTGSTWVHLGRSTRLEGAIVNDDVSHRVLSYAAPILDRATQVEGRISVELADALIPVLAAPAAQATVKGDVVFDEVRFMPGPLADQLLSIFQLERKPLLVLRDSVSVLIADRKVRQEGLIIPVGKVASIGLDGSVDFAQNLDLVARIAMVPPRSNVPVLTPLMKMAQFELPIRGTLKKPKIDGDALKERLKSFGINLLDNSLQVGVDGLQRLFQGLKAPVFRRPARPAQRVVPPPAPQADPSASGGARAPGDEDQVAETRREANKPADDRVNKKPESPKSLTAEDRKRLREQKRQERIAKKAERRSLRALPPEKSTTDERR